MGNGLNRADKLILRRRSRAPTWAGLLWRAVAFVGLIGFIVLIHVPRQHLWPRFEVVI